MKNVFVNACGYEFGDSPKKTPLGSCIGLVQHFPFELKGTLYHINGSKLGEKTCMIIGVVEKILELEKRINSKSKIFLVGGCDKLSDIYRSVITGLMESHIKFTPLDVIGSCHRSLTYLPKEHTIKIKKWDLIKSQKVSFLEFQLYPKLLLKGEYLCDRNNFNLRYLNINSINL